MQKEQDENNNTILLCEDSLEGILTGIYEAYALRRPHDRVYLQIEGDGDRLLFSEYRRVAPDEEKSAKVLRTLKNRFSDRDYGTLCFAMTSPAEDKAQAVYRTVVWALSRREDPAPLRHLSDDYVRRVTELGRSACNEWDHLRGFLRFEEWERGLLYAEAKPKNNVIPLLAPHFADRLPGENFVIRDVGRALYVIHPAFREWFLVSGHCEEQEEDGVEEVRCSGKRSAGGENARRRNDEEGTMTNGNGQRSASERYYRELFSEFCHTIGIESRENLGLQRHMLPLRFRSYMTEFT